jgi:hypothetical protein
MYVSTMKSVNYPLALPLEFLDEFKQAAKEAGLSTAATIRQSAKLGLPKFREQISSSRVTNVAPLPDKVARKLYAEREEDMDSIRRFIAAQPKDAQGGPGKSGPARSSDPIRSCWFPLRPALTGNKLWSC